MFSRISDVLPRLQVYERLYADNEHLVQAISDVYFDILNFCTDAKEVFRHPKRSIFRLSWKGFERQFGSHLESFRKHKRKVEDLAFMSHMTESSESRALIRSQIGQITESRRGRITLIRASR